MVFYLDYDPRIYGSLACTRFQIPSHISHISVSFDLVYTQIALLSTLVVNNIVTIPDKVFNQLYRENCES